MALLSLEEEEAKGILWLFGAALGGGTERQREAALREEQQAQGAAEGTSAGLRQAWSL